MQDDRHYTFRPRDVQPVTVTAHAKSKENGAELAQGKLAITARLRAVTVTALDTGPRPRVFDPASKSFVDVPKGTYVADERIHLRAELQGDNQPAEVRWRWAVDDGTTLSNNASQTPTVSRHETGTIQAKAEAVDPDGILLGSGSISLPVTVPADRVNPLLVEVTADRATIRSGESTAVHAMAKGGSPPYSFQWDSPAGRQGQDLTIAGEAPGRLTASVTVRDANGRSGAARVEIKIEPVTLEVKLAAEAAALKVGDQAMLTATVPRRH